MTKPIPDGFHTITPYLVVKGASDAIDFYKKAFGATELTRSLDERNGRVMNAKLRIGDSIFMLNDEYPEFGIAGITRNPNGRWMMGRLVRGPSLHDGRSLRPRHSGPPS